MHHLLIAFTMIFMAGLWAHWAYADAKARGKIMWLHWVVVIVSLCTAILWATAP